MRHLTNPVCNANSRPQRGENRVKEHFCLILKTIALWYLISAIVVTPGFGKAGGKSLGIAGAYYEIEGDVSMKKIRGGAFDVGGSRDIIGNGTFNFGLETTKVTTTSHFSYEYESWGFTIGSKYTSHAYGTNSTVFLFRQRRSGIYRAFHV